MKLAVIEREHILRAAAEMDLEGDNSWAEYWVRFDNGKEYQFKHLVKRAYEIVTGEMINNDFFQSNDGYRSFIERKFGYKVIFRIPDNIPFFAKDNIVFFSQHAGSFYRSENKGHIASGKRIKEEIFKKTNVWGKLLNLDEWEYEEDNRWQLSGVFKPYSWVRIFKAKDRNSKVFFTLGVDGYEQALVYKLDCQRKQYASENALTFEQVAAFDRVRNGTGAEWNEISIDDLSNYDWETLRQTTTDFIGRYEFLYDEAIEAVQTATQIKTSEKPEESLEEFPVPEKAFDKLPDKKYSFKGVIIDYDAENKNSKDIGDGGEELVITKEKEFLLENGLNDLACEVKKAKDGEGYDVLSFDLNRSKKFIEVKTTTGINTRPFIMTDNEWEFMRRFSDQYHLYRIYNYDKVTKRGKLFCISGNIEEMVFTRQKQIEVFLKTKNSYLKPK
jgi:hypothetical protein